MMRICATAIGAWFAERKWDDLCGWRSSFLTGSAPSKTRTFAMLALRVALASKP